MFNSRESYLLGPNVTKGVDRGLTVTAVPLTIPSREEFRYVHNGPLHDGPLPSSNRRIDGRCRYGTGGSPTRRACTDDSFAKAPRPSSTRDRTLGTHSGAEGVERVETSPYATIFCRRSSFGMLQTSRSGVSCCGTLVRFYFPPSASFYPSLQSFLPDFSLYHELPDKIPYAPTVHKAIVAAQATEFLWRRAATLQVDLEFLRRRLKDKGLG
ncbi:hypothetical protein B0H19DRAFT_1323099 [Mycena capillaripes]|nr:hypothetical protein B0H19DRAFT_1323099 [Mycena capillaripes]